VCLSPQPSHHLTILSDDIETLSPILNFERYSETVIDMIKHSFPKFSVGIYGDWGMGKTTLMRLIEKRLEKEEEILTVWFDAWRYEREDQFAVVSLIKSIAYRMDEHRGYKKAGEVLLKSLITVAKGLASRYLVTEKSSEEFQRNFVSNMQILAEADKDTIYFHGLKKIQDSISEIRKPSPSSRVVIFIDDLDRCSPDRVLDVLDSIKVFLDIEGFVFVLGLSHIKINKIINAKFENSGISGEEYLRKIIQMPITIPYWNETDVNKLIDNLAERTESYGQLIKEKKHLIIRATELNPREVKRFINKFIFLMEVIPSIGQKDELPVILALENKWNEFFKLFSTRNEFRRHVRRYAEMAEFMREKAFEEKPEGKEEQELYRFTKDLELWSFLSYNKDIIFSINNWENYQRWVESVRDTRTSDDEIYIRQGDFLYESKRYVDAIPYYDKALELEPKDANAWYKKGRALSRRGKYEDAINCYDKAIEISPHHVDTWKKRGEALYSLKEYDLANESYDRATSINSDDTDLWTARSRCEYHLKNYEKAIEFATKAIELDPSVAYAWFTKGRSLIKLKRFDKALEALNQTIQLDPNMTRAWWRRGQVHEALGKIEEALADYRQALKLDRDFARASNAIKSIESKKKD
jgi:tetratricopeptide (TPR) repeat protein